MSDLERALRAEAEVQRLRDALRGLYGIATTPTQHFNEQPAARAIAALIRRTFPTIATVVATSTVAHDLLGAPRRPVTEQTVADLREAGFGEEVVAIAEELAAKRADTRRWAQSAGRTAVPGPSQVPHVTPSGVIPVVADKTVTVSRKSLKLLYECARDYDRRIPADWPQEWVYEIETALGTAHPPPVR